MYRTASGRSVSGGLPPHYVTYATAWVSYKPDYEQLHKLNAAVKTTEKTMNLYQLDMLDIVSNTHRSELEVVIQ